MNRYLLDTNHLAAYLDRKPNLEHRIDSAIKTGERLGICLPVLCEYRAGIQISKRRSQNLSRLQSALSVLRIWPADETTGAHFAAIFEELRAAGTMISQFDLLIAAITRHYGLTLLTADRDFQVVAGIKIENWL